MTCTTNRRTKPSRTYYPHVGNLFNELFNTAVGDIVNNVEGKKFTNPATNVIEHDDRFELEVSLPGFSKEDIEIKMEDEKLTIKAKEQSTQETLNYRLREWNYKGFEKHYKISEMIDTTAITASFDQGVLNIILAKKKEAIPQPPKEIKIK